MMLQVREALVLISTMFLLTAPLATPAAGRTVVSIKGRDVTITVPIDAIGADKRTAGEWKKSAEDLWNAAFDDANNPFKGCLKLKLVVDVKAQRMDYPAQDGRHMVFASQGGGPNTPKGTIVGYGAAQGDNIGPYQTSDDGNFDESFGDPSKANYVAHEVGHLLGLGDDYTEISQNPRKTKPIPGRENTLMADGGRIDADLLKRLVDLLRKATHEIPDCRWKGKLQGRATGNIYNDQADAVFAFTERADGTIAGNAHVRMSHQPETFPGGCVYTRTQVPEEFDVPIAGKRNGDQFELNFSAATATYTIAAKCPGHAGSRSSPGMDAFMGAIDVVLHPAKVPAKDGRTTLQHTFYSTSANTYVVNGTIEIEPVKDECPMDRPLGNC